MIKYIGSKRTLVPRIVNLVGHVPGVRTVCDMFGGTTRVGHGLKAAGFDVTTNDLASYSEVLGITYVEANRSAMDLAGLEEQLQHLMALPGTDGYFTQTFCEQARFFQPRNGRRVDAMRPAIDEIATDRIERGILLTSLMEAADRVDSTCGVQMAYLKSWAKRSYNDIDLRLPSIIDGPGRAIRCDANQLAPALDGIDLVYLDPPYNQHSYYSNYHIWETLIQGDAPEHYGIARKRVDCRTTKSDYNSKRRAWAAFSDLVRSLQAPYLLVSFSDEGYLPAGEIEALLAERGEVAVSGVNFKRYVGAQIGIHDPSGARVGKVGRLRNTEYLFLVGDGARAIMESAERDHQADAAAQLVMG